MNILVTGCAGFIGFHVARSLLKNKNNYVIGIDSINNYYSKNLKFDLFHHEIICMLLYY